MNGGRFFFWRSKPRRDQLTADLEYPVTWDDAGAARPIKKILSWGLGAASVGVVYATAGSVVWSAYDQLGRHGVAAPPPLIIVAAPTFKASPGEQAERVGPERVRPPVGVTVLTRVDQLAEKADAVLPAPQMSIKLAAAHQLSARAEPARLEDEERPQSMVALMAPKPSRDLPATAARPEAISPSGSGASPPPPRPSLKPTRSSVPIELATLGLPKPAFKPNQEVAAAPAARIEPVSSPIDYLRNWFGRVVAVMEAGALASDRFFVASSDRGDRNDGGGGSNQASGGSVADSGGASNDAASSGGDDRGSGSGNNGNGNGNNGNGNGNGRGDRDDDD